jgi:hypothetical protein
MAIGRRPGGTPRWLGMYAMLCAAALLFTLTVVYLTTVHVRTAVAEFARHSADPRPVHGIPYASLINRIAAAHRLDPALVAAVVAAESGFDPRARSARGAYGLMQVMPQTWREIAVRPVCRAGSAGGEGGPRAAGRATPPCMDDPALNLEVGAAYLRRLIDRFGGDTVLAVAAYNAGADTVVRHGGVPPFPETARYLRQVALAWFHLERQGTLTPFWLAVIRSFDLWQHARPVLLAALGVLALPWLWPLPGRGPEPVVPR